MAKIQVCVWMKIRTSRKEFKRQAAEYFKQVKEKDLGTLQYDWFLSSDQTECEIRKTYEIFEAALVHQSILRRILRTVFEKFGSAHSVVI